MHPTITVMTPAPDMLPVACDHLELVELLKRRRLDLDMSQHDLDARSGLADGHIGKLEKPDGKTRDGKKWGRRTTLGPVFDTWLEALGVGIALVPLDQIDRRPRQLAFAFVADMPAAPRRPPRKSVHQVHHIDSVNPDDRRREQAA